MSLTSLEARTSSATGMTTSCTTCFIQVDHIHGLLKAFILRVKQARLLASLMAWEDSATLSSNVITEGFSLETKDLAGGETLSLSRCISQLISFGMENIPQPYGPSAFDLV